MANAYVELKVHAYDWNVIDADIDTDTTAIHCWALDKNSDPYLLRFRDFPVFCFIELPMYVNNRYQQWSRSYVDHFIKDLSFRLGDHAPIRYNLHYTNKIYYYRNNIKYPMIQVCFTTLEAMNHCCNLLKRPIKTNMWGPISCNVYETKIPLYRKLLTVKNTKFAEWFKIQGTKVEDGMNISTLENEYIVSWNSMIPLTPEECLGWVTEPGRLAIDIECYSDRHLAMPDKHNAKHVVYIISCVYEKFNQERTRYAIVLGPCDQIPEERLSNCHIINVNTELELHHAFAEVVRITDPEIILGYNIFGFDYPYMDTRLKRVLQDWPQMGRIIGKKAVLEGNPWESKAYGKMAINMLVMDGRISLDMMPIIKRDHKLDQYNLNFVSKHFISETKHDVSPQEMFLIYERCQRAKSLAEDDPEYIAAKAEMTRVVEYCICDSELVLKLFNKMNVWIGQVEMSSIVGVPIQHLSTKGQQHRCLSQIYDLAARLGYVLDSRDAPTYGYSGGFVFDPIPGIYDNIICLDFASLYPNIIRAYNICYSTLVPPEMMSRVDPNDCHVIKFTQEEVYDPEGDNIDAETGEIKKVPKSKIQKQNVEYEFWFYKNREGIIPQLLRELIMSRKRVNGQMNAEKDRYSIYQKVDNFYRALQIYVASPISVPSIAEAEATLKSMTTSVPPAPAHEIIDAKRRLNMAQMFDINFTSKCQTDIEKSKAESKTVLPQWETCVSYLTQLSQYHNENNQAGIADVMAQWSTIYGAFVEVMKDSKLLITVLNQRQLGIKVSANSVYGFLGVQNGGLLPLIEGAMSVTAMGRRLINEVRVYIEEKYGGVQIYGDTDSVMMDMHVKDPKECEYWGIRLAQEITGLPPGAKDCDGNVWPEGRKGIFLSPLALEFEKGMRMLSLCKKRYAAYLIGKGGEFKMEDIVDRLGNVVGSKRQFLTRGIILARRDNCPFARRVYAGILDMVMNGSSFEATMEYLIDAVLELINGKVPVEELVVTKALGTSYASESNCMKIFADNLKKAGKIVSPGDRLPYVLIKTYDGSDKVGPKMRLIDQYHEALNTDTPYEIDVSCYLTKCLSKPINQLISIGFQKVIDRYASITYKRTPRCKPDGLRTPVKVITNMIGLGLDPHILMDQIREISQQYQ